MRFTFRHVTGSRAGQDQVVEGRVVNVGRNPTNLLAFDPEKDDRVSGNHAQLLVLDDGRVVLSDLGSRNGTLINGQKIAGQVPLTPGMTVQFGSDGGPQVTITWGEAPAAPAPAPAAPPKKGGGGTVVLVCGLLLLLLLCVGGGVAVLLLRGGKDSTPGTAPPPAATDVAATEKPPATEAATETPPATEKPAVVDRRTPWGKLGVGSTFEQKSLTEMKVGETVMKTESKMVYTVTAVGEAEVTVKMDIITEIPGVGPNTTTNETKFPARVAEGEATKPTEEPEKRKDKVTVPAGTFDCTVYTTRTKDANGETVTESYMGDDEPLPYKTVLKGPTMTSTTELVKADKK